MRRTADGELQSRWMSEGRPAVRMKRPASEIIADKLDAELGVFARRLDERMRVVLTGGPRGVVEIKVAAGKQ